MLFSGHRLFYKAIVGLSLIGILLSSCAPSVLEGSRPDSTAQWNLSDLQWLRDSEIINEEATLAAVYSRSIHQDLEVRIDLLDIQEPLAFDVYLALDTQPGGSTHLPGGKQTELAWDALLIFSAEGEPYALSADGSSNKEIVPRILRDPFMDCLVIQINQNSLPGDPHRLGIQVFITPPGGDEPLDQTPVIKGSSQFKPAQALISFWNTLPAATPAQALRRWDGAHTGPSGQRHGLAVLLKAAANWQIPLFLLDLKNPDSMAALGLLGGLHWIQTLEQKGLVTSSEFMEGGDSTNLPLRNFQLNSTSLTFPTSSVRFGPFQSPLPSLGIYFADLADKTHAVRWQGKIILPLPSPVYQAAENATNQAQVSPAGPALEIKKALLEAAISRDSRRLVGLGGDLTISPWANFDTSGPAMQYLANHPWIKVLNEKDLEQLPAPDSPEWPASPCSDLLCSPPPSAIIPISNLGLPIKSGMNSIQIKTKIQEAISSLPDSAFKDIAWLANINLTSPSMDPKRTALQANYLGSIGTLLEAARWESNPYERADCATDMDWDGEPECVLSSQKMFSIIEPSNGCLVMLAAQGLNHPAIMPTSMVSVGLGDPTFWKLDLGTAADADILQGAFCFSGVDQQNLSFHVGNNSIRFGDTIEYQISGNQFQIKISQPAALSSRIPFLLMEPGVDYRQQLSELPGFLPGMKDLVAASLAPIILTINPPTIPLSYATSFDSLAYLNQPEIPDRSNPEGHFIPFPFAFLNLKLEEPAVLTFQFP